MITTPSLPLKPKTELWNKQANEKVSREVPFKTVANFKKIRRSLIVNGDTKDSVGYLMTSRSHTEFLNKPFKIVVKLRKYLCHKLMI